MVVLKTQCLQIEDTTTRSTTQVLTQEKMQQHMRKKTKILQKHVAVLKVNVDKLCHEQDKMTDNEHTWTEILNQQRVSLTKKVTQILEAQTA